MILLNVPIAVAPWFRVWGFATVERAPGAVRPPGGARLRSTRTHPIHPSYTLLRFRVCLATEVPKQMQRQESAAGAAISAFAGIYRRFCRCRDNSALAGGDAVCKVGRGSARGRGWRPLAETAARSQAGEQVSGTAGSAHGRRIMQSSLAYVESTPPLLQMPFWGSEIDNSVAGPERVSGWSFFLLIWEQF